MMIKLENNWQIDSDGDCYILRQATGKVDKNGKPLYYGQTYHASVKQAMERHIKRKQMVAVMENEMSLAEAVIAFSKINEEMERMLEKVGG